jgi:two-component system, NtrC family, response regulator AtoC
MPSRKHRELRLRDFYVTRSAAMRPVLATAAKVVDHDVNVLIVGESGTGKDYLAEAIHASGSRRSEPFVHVDCASIPADLFESELFGYEKGTFTGALTRKNGKLEAAKRGTLYLDDVAALSPALQAKLLRVLQERTFARLGGHQQLPFEARVIASLSAPPEQLAASGGMRRDLLYRLNVVLITLPPLRDRGEDVQILARRFLRQQSRHGRTEFDADTLAALAAYSWPGNIRELKNVVERAALLEEGSTISLASLPVWGGPSLVQQAAEGVWTLEQLEAEYIRNVLRATRNNFSRAAEILGINRKTLLEKRKRYGIAGTGE